MASSTVASLAEQFILRLLPVGPMKSLGEQMAFYAAYHQHPMNRATHFVGVPLLVYSLMVGLGAWPRIDIGMPFALSPALVVAVVVLVYYVVLDVLLGLAMFFVFGALFAAAEWTQGLGTETAVIVFGVTFVVGWIVQLLGHGVWEKRRPALVSNLFQVFVAPIFLTAEVFFKLGYKPAVAAQVDRLVSEGAGGTSPRV